MIGASIAGLGAMAAVAFGSVALGDGSSSSVTPDRDVDARRRWSIRRSSVVPIGIGVLSGSFLAGPIGAAILGVAGAVIPAVIRRRAHSRQAAAVESQLLDLVVSLAAALRAGRSLEQALEVAGEEVGATVGRSVGAMTDAIQLGTPADDALATWASAIATPEARLVAGVLALHRRTGGALAAPLDQLAATLRERRASARELRALTAQARLSAGILGLLPIGFFLFLATVSRSDIEAAISTPAGIVAMVVGLALQMAAFAWIRALLRPGER